MIERRFLDWSEPALPRLARALLTNRADGGELDLAGDVVVFPGARPGRRLVELLVEVADEADLRLTPPRTVTVGGLPELLYEPERPPADPVLSRRVWAESLRSRPRGRLETLIAEPPADDDLAGWAGLAGTVQGLHQEVSREGHDFRDVAERCRKGHFFDDSERWALLAEVRDAYRKTLRSLGREDRFSARIAALERGGVTPTDALGSPIRALHLVGVAEMPGVTRRMLDEVAAAGTEVTAWVHAPEALAHRFDQAGCVVVEAWRDAELSVPDDVLAVRDDPAAQAAEALRTVAGLDGTRSADEISVGVPDPELVPWLEQRFRAHGVPRRVAAGTPLARTAPFRLLEATADYVEGRRFADLAALLRHPAVDALFDGAGVLVAADRYHAAHLPARVHEGMPDRRRPEQREATLERIVERLHGPEVLGSLAPMGPRDARRSLSGWMPEVLALLERVFGSEPLSRTRSKERRLIEACERIRDAAEALHRLPPEADRACGAAQAIRVLLAGLRGPDAAVPPEPEEAAVELLGWLELHLDDAPVLVVTGFNEGRVPESVNAHPFLPNRLRSALSLLDNDGRRARDAYLLSAVLESRETVRLVAGRATGAGDPLRPSRLLLTRGGEPLARRVLRFVRSDPESPPPVAPPDLRPAERSAFTTPPQPTLALSEPPEEFSVTEFRVLLRDPYRWILERRLDLEALHDEARELDPRSFGVLAHDVLEAFAATEEAGSPDARTVAHRLDRILERLAERRFGPEALPAVPLQVEQLRRRLAAFAEWHAVRVRDGWRMAGTEVATPERGVPFDVDGEPVWLRGRIDRIDVHRDTGSVAVFDYKTGDSVDEPERVHRTRSGEWRDLQLPLYRHLLTHLEGPEGEPLVPDLGERDVGLGYLRLPKDATRVGEAMAGWDEAVLASAFERARELVRGLRERPAVSFDASRVKSGPWDPLGALLGRGVLTLAPVEEEAEA